MNRFVFFLCLSAFPCVLFGQNVSARVAGLENDQKYMELLGREQQLHRMEDSVVRIIGDTRELFSSHSSPDEREKYGAEILRLEKELYEIRNRIGVTANEIGTIEQEFIVSNMNGSGPSGTVVGPKASGEQVRNLVYNAYFRDHLSAADYRSLLEAQQKETLPGRLIARYMSNYARLDSLAAQYAATSDRQQADEIYSRLSVVRSLNEAIGDSLAGVWGFIYDNKVYAYGYLLDKMGKTELLADFEARFRKNRQQVMAVQDSVASMALYGYPLQKQLVLSYEKTLADLLGFTAASDSLEKCMAETSRLSYGMPEIDPARRVFIVYSDIERTTSSVYNARNPIPENETDQYGTVYRIQLGAFQQKQPVSIFKGVSPLCYDRTEEGRYRYCAGAFRELSEAEAAWAKLKEMGFRKPEIVVWRDGVFEMIGSGSGTSSKDGGPLYRIEISGQQENISDEIREIVSRQAPGKELTRVATGQGTFLYSVGSFDDRLSAESVCEAINAAAPGCAAVLEIAE